MMDMSMREKTFTEAEIAVTMNMSMMSNAHESIFKIMSKVCMMMEMMRNMTMCMKLRMNMS